MKSGQASIRRTVGSLQITLSNRVRISFSLQGDRILGIRDVRLAGFRLRNPRQLWRPLVTTPDGIHYAHFALRETRVRRDGSVLVRADAVGVATGIREEQDEYLGDLVEIALPREQVRDTFEWELRPSRLEVDGAELEGFAYLYRFESHAGRRIYRLFDHATWEPGGHVEGNTLLLQGQVNPPVTELKRSSFFTTACNYYGAELRGLPGPPKRVSFQRLPRIGTLQAFDFIAHARGALFGYFEPLVDVLSVVQKDAGEDVLHVVDELRRPLSSSFESHPKHILFHRAAAPWSREAQRDLWRTLYDHVHDGVRARYKVKRSPVQPRVWIPQIAKETFALDGRTYPRSRLLYALADRRLEAWAAMGVKEICTHSLWTSDYTADRRECKDDKGMHGNLVVGSICNVRVHEIDPLWGGPKALAYFVKRAHALGLQVQLWWASHLSRRAPIFRARPDFMLLARDGLPNGGGFGHHSLVTADLNNPDCFNWMLGKLCRLHEQTGFDGLFHDSYGNMTFLPMHYADPRRRGQQEAYGRFVHRLQTAGVKTLTVEGIGPLGVGHFGMDLLPKDGKLSRGYQCALNWWIGHEDMTYGLNFGIGARPWRGTDPDPREFSFRCLAAGGRFGFTQHDGKIETWHGWLRDQNRILARVAPLTGRRTLLPGDQGVLWDQGARGQLLFAFRAFDHAVPAGALVCEITPDAERPIATSAARFTPQPLSVYRIE